MSDECVYKVLLLGDTTVGKTCFLMKYTDKTFQDIHMATIGPNPQSPIPNPQSPIPR